jgi:hypothetical protein
MSGEAVAQQAGEAAAARRPGEAAAKEEDKEERTWVGPTWAHDKRRRWGIAASYHPGEKRHSPLRNGLEMLLLCGTPSNQK